MRRKLEVLTSVLGSYRQEGKEYLFSCPQCNHHKNKLSVNLDKNCWKCWICEYSGFKLHRLVRKWGTISEKELWKQFDDEIGLPTDLREYLDDLYSEEKFVEPALQLPEEFRTLTKHQNNQEYRMAKNYLASRGLADYDILYWKMGYCPYGDYGGRIIIPSFNSSGDVNYFVARAYRESLSTKYWNPKANKQKIIFNELYVDWESDLTVVEGVFDAIKATNAIPLLGSTIGKRSKTFKEIIKHDTPIYLALDPDAVKKMHRIAEELLRYDVEVHAIDTTVLSGDIGDLSKEQFAELKKTSTLITSSNLLKEKLRIAI